MKRVVLVSLLIATPAFAQGDPTTTTEAGGSASVGTPSGDATVAAGGSMGVGLDELVYSPQTLPLSAIGLEAGFGISRYTAKVMPPTPETTVTLEGFGIGGAYGVTDKITAGLSYAFSLHAPGKTFPDSGKGPLDLYGSYLVLHEAKMSLAVGGDLGFDLGSKGIGLGVGASFKYIVAPKVAIYTGNPIPIGPAGDQLTFGLKGNHNVDLHIPAGVALQATHEIFGYLGMELLSLGISHSSSSILFKDQIGVTIGALYRATPQIDVGASLTDNFKRAGDSYNIGLVFRYYMLK